MSTCSKVIPYLVLTLMLTLILSQSSPISMIKIEKTRADEPRFNVSSYRTGNSVSSVSMSADGKRVVVAGSRFVALLNENASALWTFETNDLVNSVSLSEDASYVAAGTEGSRIYLLDGRDGGVLWTFRTDGPVLSAKISGDGRFVAAGIFEGNVYLLEREQGKLLWSYRAGNITAILSVAISYGGSMVAAGSSNNKVVLLSSKLSLIHI